MSYIWHPFSSNFVDIFVQHQDAHKLFAHCHTFYTCGSYIYSFTFIVINSEIILIERANLIHIYQYDVSMQTA